MDETNLSSSVENIPVTVLTRNPKRGKIFLQMVNLPERIPVKIYYSIREVSEYTGVEPHVLRYWETKFSKLKPKRVGGNQRKYTRSDLEFIFEIMRLLYQEGYTLDGAEKKLKHGLKGIPEEPEASESNLLERMHSELTEILRLVS